ncbi:hypothetical protein BEH94_02475 [Candidatus Altiarchaeales archaeon WOR_SM1_SCG]|nr:hypothetical protein BEH94_02475 [Candidatus Altiarchaeales archaeon WOR_SM1_SCG]
MKEKRPEIFQDVKEIKNHVDLIRYVYKELNKRPEYSAAYATLKATDQYFQLQSIEYTDKLAKEIKDTNEKSTQNIQMLTKELKDFNKNSSELAEKLNLWTKILAVLTGVIAFGVLYDILKILV